VDFYLKSLANSEGHKDLRSVHLLQKSETGERLRLPRPFNGVTNSRLAVSSRPCYLARYRRRDDPAGEIGNEHRQKLTLAPQKHICSNLLTTHKIGKNGPDRNARTHRADVLRGR